GRVATACRVRHLRCQTLRLGAPDRGRRDDLSRDDLRLDLVDGVDLALRHLRTDLAEPDAALLQAVDDVAALERAVRDFLDREEAGPVDLLGRTRQDVRSEERLVGVDADPPDVLL